MVYSYGTAIKNYFLELPRGAWEGIFANFCSSVLSCVFYFLSIYFVTILHFSVATSGYILSFYSIGTMAGGLIGGRLSDKVSPQHATTIGLLIESLGYLILIFLKSPFLLMINAFVLGSASYIFLTGNYGMVLQYCQNNERKKLKSLGLLAMVANLGLSLSALLIGYFAHYSFAYIFLFSSVLLLLLAIFVCIQKNSLSSTKINPNTETKPCTPSKHRKPLLVIGFFCVFIGGSIIMQYSGTYSIYIKNTFPELGLKAVSYVFALNCILVVILQSPIVHLIQGKNKLLMVGLGAFLQGLSLLMLNFYTHYSYAMLAILIATIGEVIFFPSVQLVCHNASQEGKKGTGLGLYRTIYGGSRAFGASAGSFIYTTFSAYALWSIAGAMGLICLIVCWYWRKLAE